MGKPYSEDLRKRVVGAGLDGATIPETAERLAVSISSIVRFRRLHRETGGVSPAKFGGYKRFALAAHEELVRQLVAEQPDITLAGRSGDGKSDGRSASRRLLFNNAAAGMRDSARFRLAVLSAGRLRWSRFVAG
jgi:hypothetical protein